MHARAGRASETRACTSLTRSPRTWATAGTLAVVAVYAGMLPALGLPWQVAATVASVAAAALLSSLAGFAFSAICGAILFHFRQDTLEVVQTMLVCSIANQSLSVWALRREIRLRSLARFLAGGAAGVCAGVWLLLHLDKHVYATWLGAVLFLYGAYMLCRKPIVLRRPPLAGDTAAGFLGGLLGGFAATPGAPVSIWCAAKGLDKVAQRAIFQPYILITQLMSLGVIGAAGGHGAASLGLPASALICVPAGVAGTWWGLACFRHMGDRQFRVAMNLLLIVSGAGLAL